MRKFPAKYNWLLMPFIVTFLMTAVVSFVAIARSEGMSPEFLEVWVPAWLLSWVVAFPALLIILPNVKKLLDNITE